MKTLDYLPNSKVYLYQDSEMFKINSDTRYLGEFIELKKSDVVLDIGTNNGALLLYCNMIGCKKLMGVDINCEAIKLCDENMKLNNIDNYELYNCKVQELNIKSVDVIVCNPPYFKNSLFNNDDNLARARHEISLTVEEVVENSKRLLKDKGKLMMVYRSNEFINLVNVLSDNSFGVTRVQFIFDSNKNNSTCFLIEAIKNRKHDVKVLKPFFIEH